MGIYTKAGDAGTTRRVDGAVVPKTNPRIVAEGGVDELNVCVGLCAAQARAMADDRKASKARRDRLTELAGTMDTLQRQLLAVGSHLGFAGLRELPELPTALTDDTVAQMEAWIDATTASMPPLEGFILPGGAELACRFHHARTVCRRAERNVVAMLDADIPVPPIVLKYLNRLSDLLFTLARLANAEDRVEDIRW